MFNLLNGYEYVDVFSWPVSFPYIHSAQRVVQEYAELLINQSDHVTTPSNDIISRYVFTGDKGSIADIKAVIEKNKDQPVYKVLSEVLNTAKTLHTCDMIKLETAIIKDQYVKEIDKDYILRKRQKYIYSETEDTIILDFPYTYKVFIVIYYDTSQSTADKNRIMGQILTSKISGIESQCILDYDFEILPIVDFNTKIIMGNIYSRRVQGLASVYKFLLLSDPICANPYNINIGFKRLRDAAEILN